MGRLFVACTGGAAGPRRPTAYPPCSAAQPLTRPPPRARRRGSWQSRLEVLSKERQKREREQRRLEEVAARKQRSSTRLEQPARRNSSTNQRNQGTRRAPNNTPVAESLARRYFEKRRKSSAKSLPSRSKRVDRGTSGRPSRSKLGSRVSRSAKVARSGSIEPTSSTNQRDPGPREYPRTEGR